MRLPCNLRRIRGKRPIRDMAEVAGIHRGVLSQIETGRMVPRDDQFEPIERAYGAPRTEWWPPGVLIVLERDLPRDEAA